jgi:hypothetical protein
MSLEEIKLKLKKLWEVRFFIAGTMLFTGILDLIGLGGKADFGAGFVLGMLALITFGILAVTKKKS